MSIVRSACCSSVALLATLAIGCAGGSEVPTLGPPAAVELTSLLPDEIVPGSRLLLEGRNFSDTCEHTLELSGSLGGGDLQLSIPLAAQTVERAERQVDEALFASFGGLGTFEGQAEVISRNPAGEARSEPLGVTLQIRQHLTPALQAVGSGIVHLNTKVPVEGGGLLLGGSEGTTTVELKGCFLAAGTTGSCSSAGIQVAAKQVVQPERDGVRRRGWFEFAPAIAGIRPGTFEGTLRLQNLHVDGHSEASATLAASFQLQQTHLDALAPAAVSLGEYLDLQGAGFVDSGTLIHFQGSFTPKGGAPLPLTLDLVPGYQDGNTVRYVMEEGQGVGAAVDLRTTWGTLAGTWTPTVVWKKDQVEGQGATLSVQVAPVKQVVWVRFSQAWSESLRLFGLSAGDAAIRKRILEVMARDYKGINIEFRTEEPTDFKLYAKIDIAGRDPNGLGLLGYDNTPGKDVDNMRLYDWVGGVNALTQQDGYPGYGGVFLESLLGFSEHPPSGVQKSPLKTALFDQIFDPFRPDQGTELSTSEALAAVADSSEGCPDPSDRIRQAGCAIRILGNIVGSTASHEFGHSLGLANPYGGPTDYHNPGDLPNRLMESGSDRPFTERAELNGDGPAVFCDDEYTYLSKILPLDPAIPDPVAYRPLACRLQNSTIRAAASNAERRATQRRPGGAEASPTRRFPWLAGSQW